MAIDDGGSMDGGGGTWDASRSVSDIAEAHRTGVPSGFGPSPPPGDIGPFADRKVGHYTQVDASSRSTPTKVGGTSLIEFEAWRASAPLPPEGMASRQPATVQRRAGELHVNSLPTRQPPAVRGR